MGRPSCSCHFWPYSPRHVPLSPGNLASVPAHSVCLCRSHGPNWYEQARSVGYTSWRFGVMTVHVREIACTTTPRTTDARLETTRKCTEPIPACNLVYYQGKHVVSDDHVPRFSCGQAHVAHNLRNVFIKARLFPPPQRSPPDPSVQPPDSPPTFFLRVLASYHSKRSFNR